MLRVANHFVSIPITLLLMLEMVVLVGSVYAGVFLRFADPDAFAAPGLDNLHLSALAFSIAMVFSMSALGMYQTTFREGLKNTVLRLMPSCVMAFLLTTLAFYVLPDLHLGRGIVAFMFIVALPSILLLRGVFYLSARSRLLRTKVLFLGAGHLARECADLIQDRRVSLKYDIVGFLQAPNEEICVPADHVLKSGTSLMDSVQRCNATEIVVALQDRRGGALPIRELLECKLKGIRVTDAAAFFERDAYQIRVDSLQPSWLVFGNGFSQGFFRALCKTLFDIVVSFAVLIIASPILLLTAVLIVLEDRGPIFYRQERVGKNGRCFMVLKFRSMRTDAEAAGKPQWASSKDPRTTRIGRFIRLLRIDELPQILNVLKGDMSFVGPRPERPFFVAQLCEQIPYYDTRHSIKPGITGMAQVRYQYGASVEDALQKLQYDLYYVKNNSLFLDLLILIDTLQVVLLGKGSR